MSVLLVGVVAYLLTSLLGYVVHWAIHQSWAGKAYRAHRAHHVDLYPPKDLVSAEYRSAGAQSTVYTFLLAFSPLVAAPVALWIAGVFTLAHAAVAVAAMGTVGLLNDFFHDSYHVEGHWLARVVPGYGQLQKAHFAHHRNMRKNYGIYDHVWDRVFNTHRTE